MENPIPAQARPVLALLAICFALAGGAGYFLLREFQSSTVQAVQKARDDGDERERRILRDAYQHHVVPVDGCHLTKDWSAFRNTPGLAVEGVYVFDCGPDTYVMLPDLEAR
jgi:hypothetical protein